MTRDEERVARRYRDLTAMSAFPRAGAFGITIRQYFVAEALASVVFGNAMLMATKLDPTVAKTIGENCVMLADEVLKAEIGGLS